MQSGWYFFDEVKILSAQDTPVPVNNNFHNLLIRRYGKNYEAVRNIYLLKTPSSIQWKVKYFRLYFQFHKSDKNQG